ncbi:uncharacterized protein LOC100897516 [Galendromus occidentalis]|uniref:Uncharacterized protein LOC100897516 n=1 Tax=Galendromus occidentalis TaxID=34638 RepID=A0AAJ6VUQ3_9ACAR|nr:uncharacterized protein LOC100897516 [Galendromus occidentalis]
MSRPVRDLQRLWEVEAIGPSESAGNDLNEAEHDAIRQFEKTVSYDGRRYAVAMPKRVSIEQLSNNLEIALTRSSARRRALTRDPESMRRYDAEIMAFVRAGHAEVPKDATLSGFLLAATLREHFKRIDPTSTYALGSSFYFDDMLRSFDSDAEAIQFIDKIIEWMQSRINSTTTSSGQVPRTTWKEIGERVPKFDGNVTKFSRWKDAFVLRIDSRDWDPLEKYELMLKTLVGRAARAISGFGVIADNYTVARDTIYEDFGDSTLATNQHMENIIAACRGDLRDNAKFIRFVECIVQNVQSLLTLGNSYDGMSAPLSCMIEKALPFGCKRRLRDASRDLTGITPKSEFLVKFLKREKTDLERILHSETKFQGDKPFGSRQKNGKSFTHEYDSYQKKFSGQKFNPAGPSGSTSSQYSFALASPRVDHSCIFCGEQHPSPKCKKQLSAEERRKCAATHNACFVCLARNHRADKCRVRINCADCGGRHSTLLCVKTKKVTVDAAYARDYSEESGQETTTTIEIGEKYLPTGYVAALSETDETICRIVLDTGSQKTLITNALADILNAKQVGTDIFYLQSAGYANPRKCKGRIVEVVLKSRFSNQQVTIRATALENVIRGSLPNAGFCGNLNPVADRNDGEWSTEVDILIGVDSLYPILGCDIKKANGLIALETLFGYFPCGAAQQSAETNPWLIEAIRNKRSSWLADGKTSEKTACTSLAVISKPKADGEDLSFLWETEVMGIEPFFKDRDEAANEELNDFFEKTIRRSPSGRYVISLPYKPNKGTLGNNRRLAENRLKSLIMQARKNPKLLQAIDDEIQDLLGQGFVEQASMPDPDEDAHYLPLLAVVKKAASTADKLKTIVITADIEKAYLQFEITAKHRTYLRFLWPLGIGKNPEHRELLEFVKQHFYVDDLLVGAKSVEDGKDKVATLVEVFKTGCFPLKRFATSSRELGEYIQEKCPEATVAFGEENAKFLGVRWNQICDSIHVEVSTALLYFGNCKATKRAILKGVSQVFDPLGLLAPITLGFKLLLQRLWQKKIDWDSLIEGEELAEFDSSIEKLKVATCLNFERRFINSEVGGITELHVFCDASLTAYGCVAYARNFQESGRISTTLIIAKGRVAPLKGDWSIHRLELLGAIIAVKIVKKIQQAYLGEFSVVKFGCDNACVLAWIRDRPDRWKTFVENRIIEIQQGTKAEQWNYIRSAENPADLLSRASLLDTKSSETSGFSDQNGCDREKIREVTA